MLALAIAFGLFVWNKWRYDVVSLGTLLFLTITGVISTEAAFSGFGHPAVVTVVSVLILGRGLQNSGILEYVSKHIERTGDSTTIRLVALCATTAVLSAFINNVGALAIMMPLAIRAAKQQNRSASIYLMPLAFSSLLGGITTLIGTPPNIIVSTVRTDVLGANFELFDFSPVGLPVALVGVLFVSIFGWRVLPIRRPAEAEAAFDVGSYTTELIVPEESSTIGKSFADLQAMVEGELVLLATVDKQGRRCAVSESRSLQSGDTVVIEGPPEALKQLMDLTRLEIAASRDLEAEVQEKEAHLICEAVVPPGSSLVGKMPRAATLRRHYSVALLAIARQGRRLRKRFSQLRVTVGDVLLLRGEPSDIEDMLKDTGCLPLASREIQVGLLSNAYLAVAIFFSTILLVLVDLLPAQLAFAVGAVAMVACRIVPARTVYTHVDWSIVILIGALLPVGNALESSGAAAILVSPLIGIAGWVHPGLVLALLLVGVMLLSDIINNAAAAALAAPIAIRLAAALNASPDPFLMTVAVGASCTFLTPIGHQSNTLVMGPGGYQFTDYWRLGILVDLIVIVFGVPALLYIWPLHP